MVENIQIRKTARIARFGNPNSAKMAVLALHGYGQLVPYFIRNFQQLDENNICVIAP
jgi:S-ribosylhomocysteine lyase LuxS involved in autoinducer biosynthesis